MINDYKFIHITLLVVLDICINNINGLIFGSKTVSNGD